MTTNAARLEIANGPLVEAVLSRVVGMLAARALCPIDRLDDALLVTDAIAAHAPSFTTDGRVCVTVSAQAEGITLLVAPLRERGAAELLAAVELPGVGNVLKRVADDVTTGDGEDGEQLSVHLAFHPG